MGDAGQEEEEQKRDVDRNKEPEKDKTFASLTNT